MTKHDLPICSLLHRTSELKEGLKTAPVIGAGALTVLAVALLTQCWKTLLMVARFAL
jgi:hypothetical protein